MAEGISIGVEGTVELSPERVFRYLEYGGASPSKPVLEKLDELIPMARKLAQSRTLSRICGVGEAENLHENDLPTPIQGASFLAFGLVTVGPAIEQEAERLRETGRLLDSMILDALGSAAVSKLCERLADRVFDWAHERDLNASRAFEPGSGASHWPLESQRLIFANLHAEEIDVSLTSHLLMQPTKTLSFLMGIGSEIEQASTPFSCQGCVRLDCSYRYEPSRSIHRRGR
ncbi:hypothetical protein KAX17_04920 [Candidatus Bipolaricaulota bacterium]|nr:hypothetical protein [Candidatus Bipolaricaulota bacterium]